MSSLIDAYISPIKNSSKNERTTRPHNQLSIDNMSLYIVAKNSITTPVC